METQTCCICYDECIDLTICNHSVHFECMKMYGKNICPICQKNKCIDQQHFLLKTNDDFEYYNEGWSISSEVDDSSDDEEDEEDEGDEESSYHPHDISHINFVEGQYVGQGFVVYHHQNVVFYNYLDDGSSYARLKFNNILVDICCEYNSPQHMQILRVVLL